jgi:transketolase
MFFTDNNNIKQLSNAIRFLAVDAVEKAKSGHPGMPMGFADIATILFSEFLKFNPQDPNWPNRDRFVLSAGHGSMLLYSLLYLTGYDLSIEDIKNFRSLGSKTPGHPEYGHTVGVETTTGPLGQGLANAVGMAIGQQLWQARTGKDVINYKTYAVVGDGCLMEGISYEAASLAGHLRLKDLIVLYDSNKISIDGSTDLTFTENVSQRFTAQKWNVFEANGHDFDEIRGAIYKATKSDKPSLVIFHTKIGFGSPNKESSEKCHGSPLGAEEIALARERLNYPYNSFEVPQDILDKWRNIGKKNLKIYNEWQEHNKGKIESLLQSNIENICQSLDELASSYKGDELEATRKTLHKILTKITSKSPLMICGSADLSESNGLKITDHEMIRSDNFYGNYIHYGVREHAMGAIMNGLALTGFTAVGGSFLVFADYMRPAIRLAALMKLPIIYIFTHDSIGVGEDGPTHQPIEHLASLRIIPNLSVYRPADARETIDCFKKALRNKNGPSLLALSRQQLTQIMADKMVEGKSENKVNILASGSEVEIAIKAAKIMAAENLAETTVFSVPNVRDFDKNNLKNDAINIAIEASNDQSWYRLIGDQGVFIGMDSFGSSGKADDLFDFYGINADKIVSIVRLKINEQKNKSSN